MRRLLPLLTLAACVAQAPNAAAPDAPPATPPSALEALAADFAEGADTVSLLERDGSLRLLPWGGSEVALEHVSDTLFVAGPGDTVRLTHGPGTAAGGVAGPGTALLRGGRSFARLVLGPADGAIFRIEPLRPPEELLAEALAAQPPQEEGDFLESDLAELVALDPTIRLDVRYATTNNFMGEVFYSQPRAFLQRPAADAVVRAHRWLLERGYGLLIHDGYRPWYVTKMFWDATPTHLREFVANPDRGSRHNRGCAVDLTLFEVATGRAVEMPSGYDEFSPRAYAEYPGGTSRRRAHRALLRQAMEAQGFTANPSEWWHFDYGDWRRYRLANQRFEELGRAGSAMSIEHISDTARWVALYRALESERPDAHFRDPFARVLAGAKGEDILDAIPKARTMGWPMVVRTVVFDELLRERIAQGADAVVNLAAGLDARPWRMDLPRSLRWADVDLEGILRHKTDAMAHHPPRCDYRAVHADLTEAATRSRVLADAMDGARNAVVLTEGLLVYLTREQVAALARDLAAQTACRWWITDLGSPLLERFMVKAWGDAVSRGNAPFRFFPPEGTGFFRPLGWTEAEFRSTGDEARRLHRTMRGAWLWGFMSLLMPAQRRREMHRMSGAVLLKRADD